MSFQSKVNLMPAKGWSGDFASTNVRVSLFGDGVFQVGEGGVHAGSFVWIDEATQTVVNNGKGAPAGFVGRELTGVPAEYLDAASLLIPAGLMVTVYEKGEFLVLLRKDGEDVKRGDVVLVSLLGGYLVTNGTTDAVETIQTSYKYVTDAKPGELVAISAWI